MKKKVFLLLTVCLSVCLFTACSDDDDDIKDEFVELEGLYGETDDSVGSLELNYGEGNEFLGRSVHFRPTGGDYATITLNNIIPGEEKTELKKVELSAVDRVSNKFSFKGEDKAKDGRKIDYTGAIAEGKMQLTVEVVMPDNDVVGKWDLDEEAPIHFVWESDAKITIPGGMIEGIDEDWEIETGDIVELFSYAISPRLKTVLRSISLGKDGDVIAEYSEAGASEIDFQPSTPNLAHYYVNNKKIYALLNTEMIIKEAAKGRSQSSTLESLLVTGIPVNYELANKELTLFVDKELFNLIFSDSTVQELFGQLKEKIEDLLGEDILEEGEKEILEYVVAEFKEVLSKTTKLELGLNMISAE